MRNRLLALFLGMACSLVIVGDGYAQEAWTHYRNKRFGTSIDYQEFFEPGPPSVNGDGQSWGGPEDTTFSVFASENVQRQSLAGYQADLLADGNHQNLSYRAASGRRLVLSGLRGALIYYEVYLFPPSGRIHGFVMEYPARYKKDYDASVRRMASSFRGD